MNPQITLAILIGFSLVYFLIRKSRNHYLETNFKMDLYEVRDELRKLAIVNSIDSSSWVFEYFDLTISKLINTSYYISLPFIVLADRKHENDEKEMKKFLSKLDYECKKKPEFNTIRGKISAIVAIYLIEQHKYSFTHIAYFCFKFLNQIKSGMVKKLSKKFDLTKRANDIFTLPETSAIPC